MHSPKSDNPIVIVDVKQTNDRGKLPALQYRVIMCALVTWLWSYVRVIVAKGAATRYDSPARSLPIALYMGQS